ncbi:MAG: tetratricopeptide repeat protein [Thermomicrobiales bacterium]|nr:tetratricopeptide repeat protein [Thermomicrobiales bacterium]
MSDALWDFARPEESERRFRALLLDGDDSMPSAERIEILTQIARAQGLQGRFADGHATLDDAERLTGAWATRAGVRIALERGRLFNSAGSAELAVTWFLRALELAEACEEIALEIDAAHMLGIAAPVGERLDWNFRALAIAEASSDAAARGWIGPMLNNIGWTYHERGAFDAALDAFERAVPVRREGGQIRETRIAEWSVARALRSLGRFEEALSIQSRLAGEWAAGGDTDPYVEEELGECLLALGRAMEAESHFAAAFEALCRDEWLRSNEPARLDRLEHLSKRR